MKHFLFFLVLIGVGFSTVNAQEPENCIPVDIKYTSTDNNQIEFCKLSESYMLVGKTDSMGGLVTIEISRKTLDAVMGNCEPDMFFTLINTEEVRYDETITPTHRIIKIDLPTGNVKLEILGTNTLFSPHPSQYCGASNGYSSQFVPALKQIRAGMPLDNILCNENLVLIQKHDDSPACVKPETKERLIKRGWTEITEIINTSDSTKFCGKSLEQIQSETPFHILAPQNLPDEYSLRSTDNASPGTILLNYAKGNTCGSNPETLKDGKIELVVAFDPNGSDKTNGTKFLDDYKEKYEQNNVEYRTTITDNGLYIIGIGMETGTSITIDENENTIYEDTFDNAARVYVLDTNTDAAYKIMAYFPLEHMMSIAESLD